MSSPRRFDWLFRPQIADEDEPLSAEARFADAMAELPAVERSALALSEIGGLDTDEIADRLGTDRELVQTLLVRARRSVRASIAARGRGLVALLPLQNLWQAGASAPVRTAGVVAAAMLAPAVVLGGHAAGPPQAVLSSPDAPRARVLEPPARATSAAPRSPVFAPTGSGSGRKARAAASKRPAARPVAPQRRQPSAPARRKQALPVAVPARAPEAAQPSQPQAEPVPRRVPRTLPRPASPPVSLPAPLPELDLPVAPPLPVLPVIPVPLPELPPAPPVLPVPPVLP